MIDHMKKEMIDRSYLIEHYDNTQIIQICKDILPDNVYNTIINKSLGYDRMATKYNDEYLPIINSISKISPSQIIITTNLDNCLEETEKFNKWKVYDKISDLLISNTKGKTIFKIHGAKNDIENSVLSKRQYLYRYNDINYKNFLINIFQNFHIIFLASSCEDAIRNVMIMANTFNLSSHYLVSETGKYNSTDKTIYKSHYGIDIIDYGKLDYFQKVLSEWIDTCFQNLIKVDENE